MKTGHQVIVDRNEEAHLEANNLRPTVRSLVENSHRSCFLKDARGKKHELFSFGTAAPSPPPPPGGIKRGEGWKYERASSKPKRRGDPTDLFPRDRPSNFPGFSSLFRSFFFPLNLSSPFRPLVPPPPPPFPSLFLPPLIWLSLLIKNPSLPPHPAEKLAESESGD